MIRLTKTWSFFPYRLMNSYQDAQGRIKTRLIREYVKLNNQASNKAKHRVIELPNHNKMQGIAILAIASKFLEGNHNNLINTNNPQTHMAISKGLT